jgi:hypothetical protein
MQSVLATTLRNAGPDAGLTILKAPHHDHEDNPRFGLGPGARSDNNDHSRLSTWSWLSPKHNQIRREPCECPCSGDPFSSHSKR